MKNIGIVLLLIILPVFFYLEFASFQNIFSQKDWLVRTYPLREEAIKMIKDKILPLWNPYILCGNPLFANIDIAIGYPFYIFDFFMSAGKAVKWNFLLHISLGGIFMYLFLKVLNLTPFGAIVGAITFMFGGYMQSFIPHPELWVTTIYIPLIFSLFELGLRKEKNIYIVFGGIALALQILSGVPQIVYYTLLALFLYAIYYSLVRDRSAKFTPIYYFIGLALLGFCLSAFQLIPTYEYYLQSAKYHFQIAGDASQLMPVLSHAILFFIGVADPYTSGFIGIAGLLLALFAILLRRNKLTFFFAGLSVLVLISVFEITKFYKILFYVPGFNMFNSLHRFISIYAFGISILAGFGAASLSDALNSEKSPYRRRLYLTLLIIACIIIISAAVTYLFKDHIINYGQKFVEAKVLARPGHPFSAQYYYKKLDDLYNAASNVIQIAILPVLGLLLITALKGKKRLKNAAFQIGLASIVILELYGHWQRLDWKLVDPVEYYRPGEAISFIKKDTSIYRAFGLDSSNRYHFDFENNQKINELLTPNLATVHHIHDPQGMNNFNQWSYWQVLNLINRGKSPLEGVFSRDPFHLLAITNPHHNLLDLLNIKYLLTYHPIEENKRWELVFDNGVKVYQNKKVIPRAFMGYDYKRIQDEDTLLRTLNNPDFNAREIVIVDKDIDGVIGSASSNSVDIKRYNPLEVKIDVYTENPGILVLGDSFYPGWRARVDGIPQKIVRAYSIFRAVHIPQGKHEVTFFYRPLSFIAGLFITMVTIIMLVFEGIRRLFKS